MATEVWMRNPDNYIRECLEINVTDFVWDFGVLHKKSIDAKRFAELYMPQMRYRMWVMGDQGAYLFDNDTTPEKPLSRALVWEYGQSLSTLEAMMLLKRDDNLDHRIFISRTPPSHSWAGKSFLRTLIEMQEEYPESILHIHGLYGYPAMYGLGFKAVDCDPRTAAQKGKIMLPNGKDIAIEYAPDYKMWIDLLETKMSDLRVPRNRCIYNIKSALWAGKNYQEAIKIRTRGNKHSVDPDDPNPKPPETKRIMAKNKKPSEGDLFMCDMCSLQLSCRYFRVGAVCIVPESEPLELAKFFKSRDVDVIMEGLATLLAAETHRLERGLQAETTRMESLDGEDSKGKGGLDPEVTKIINTLFDRGVKLAKLRDPTLLGGPKIQITNQTAITSGSTPQQLMAGIVDMFVKQGISRDQITPQMVMSVLEPEDAKQRAIEAGSTEKTA